MVRGARTRITLNKPIAVGFSILEISKFIMYSFYYDHLQAKYADRCTLLFTDTDNLCCERRTDDLYADMMDSLDLYDTSNFDPKLPQYNVDNRRELGKFKSETGSVPPREFVGLRAKMYSLQAPTKNFKKAKGIQKCSKARQALKFPRGPAQNAPKHYCKVLCDQVGEARGKYSGIYKVMLMCLR